MKKVISVVGARPNFMKVAPIHREFQKYKDQVEHMIVHTGQHYDKNMSDAFFEDLEMPDPHFFLGIGSGSHAQQTAKIMIEFEKILIDEKPDLILVVGDVNSTIACALTAVKLHIPVAHIESGLRSNDRKMPEEINRIATDSICDYCFVTEEDGIRNLISSSFPQEKIFFVGNTMIDSQHFALEKADQINTPEKLGLEKANYVVLTIHRPSNVDLKDQLEMLVEVFEEISKDIKLVFPVHPRTMKNLEKFGLIDRFNSIENLVKTEPMGYVAFLSLVKNSAFVMTDSGGIQEETTALGVQCLTLRTSTERPSTVEIGTNQLIYPRKEEVLTSAKKLISGEIKVGRVPDLWDGKASERICSIILNNILA